MRAAAAARRGFSFLQNLNMLRLFEYIVGDRKPVFG
jgi:hypothetical protein